MPGGLIRACVIRSSHTSLTASIMIQTRGNRLIVGISGASGIVYGIRLLELLHQTDVETHLIVSRAGETTREQELDLSAQEMRRLATVVHRNSDIGASIASGSFRTQGMIIAPCSVKTLAEIATGVTSSLLTRAADVVLKERRRLVLVVRETPLNLIHLRNMATVTEAGGIVMPPVPAFYNAPASIDEMVTTTMCRALDLFDIDVGIQRRWGEQINPDRHRSAADPSTPSD
jgi:4-hydroxy-3-polyprenylbenzoate decarboxylase